MDYQYSDLRRHRQQGNRREPFRGGRADVNDPFTGGSWKHDLAGWQDERGDGLNRGGSQEQAIKGGFSVKGQAERLHDWRPQRDIIRKSPSSQPHWVSEGSGVNRSASLRRRTQQPSGGAPKLGPSRPLARIRGPPQDIIYSPTQPHNVFGDIAKSRTSVPAGPRVLSKRPRGTLGDRFPPRQTFQGQRFDVHQSSDENDDDESDITLAVEPPSTPFARPISKASRFDKAHAASSIANDDCIDIDFAERAATFINQPPGRVLTPYELETILTVVFGFDKGKLYSKQEWFNKKAQDLALSVLTAKNTTWRDFAELEQARGRAAYMLETERLDSFLAGINELIQKNEARELQNWLVVDPPFNESYTAISIRLKNLPKDFNLVELVRGALTEAHKHEWSSLIPFVVQYLVFLRDLDINNLLEAYELLKELLAKGNIALQHNTCGHLILPTVIKYSQLLSQFAIRLDKQPESIVHLPRAVGEEGSESLPERTANIIRQAFVTCLNDRTDPNNNAEYSRKFGIYTLANICLKILFACKKSGSAEQIFTNVYNQAPALSLYPKSEQVSYLYYLGRFLWTTGHWYRAQLALQSAYNMCPSWENAKKQRRNILVYLIASNMILGRFPSQELYSRPEATGFIEIFHPICRSIAKGDLESFYRLLDMNGPYAGWLLKFRILLQLRNRCEVLVWRTLARTAFLINGRTPDDDRRAPTLDLHDFWIYYTLLQMRTRVPPELLASIPFNQTCDEWRNDEKFQPYMQLNVHRSFQDEDGLDWTIPLPKMLVIESIFSSLVGQGLLGGFVSHKQLRFAIQGARQRGALAAGFPNVWHTVTDGEEDEVPGWKAEPSGFGAATGGGRVIHLTNARPVGVAPAG